MRSFWVRAINLIAMVGILLFYHMALVHRSSEDQVARLHAELESAKLELDIDRELLASAGYTFVGSEMGQDAQPGSVVYQDGAYSGEAQGFGGQISLEVTIEGGKIIDIQILAAEGEDVAYLSMAEGMIPAIIERQSSEVDTVSGATFSSNGIKNAVIQALGKAGGK